LKRLTFQSSNRRGVVQQKIEDEIDFLAVHLDLEPYLLGPPANINAMDMDMDMDMDMNTTRTTDPNANAQSINKLNVSRYTYAYCSLNTVFNTQLSIQYQQIF